VTIAAAVPCTTRAAISQAVSADPSMNAIEDASTQAASTMRRRRSGASRPSSRGQGSASITPRLQGSTNGCAIHRTVRKEAYATARPQCASNLIGVARLAFPEQLVEIVFKAVLPPA
jgi:hypothetical protein